MRLPVSSRAPVWGASGKAPSSPRRYSRFQVVPPCGGHHPDDGLISGIDDSFKSCPRVGGIRYGGVYVCCTYRFQVVPPCGGHLFASIDELHQHPVSSRAPVWGASHRSSSVRRPTRVSSRAPVWGASTKRQLNPLKIMFQVVPPCGGHQNGGLAMATVDLFQVVPPCGGHLVQCAVLVEAQVSSRAPVWGASCSKLQGSPPGRGFKSCPRVGGIAPYIRWRVSPARFQVVPPCGGHPANSRMNVPSLTGVSSRAPVWGASIINVKMHIPKGVSSRAPVWGASSLAQRRRRGDPVSSRAPVWGASDAQADAAQSASVSSRAPVWGASPCTASCAPPALLFQVVPPCGGHLITSLLGVHLRLQFQVVPPCGGHL